MKNLRIKIIAISFAIILSIFNFSNANYSFATSSSVSSTGYIDLPDFLVVGKVNVRSKPSTSSTILGTIKNGEIINILDGITEDEDKDGYLQGWYKVSYNNLSGYVFGDYVKLHEDKGIYYPSNTTPIKGIDVSRHQGIIDWKKVKSDGINFAIIRGGYSTIEDEMFKTNIEGALNAGIDVGVYWFSHAYTTDRAIAEANKCMSVIGPYKDKLSYPVYFDFEEEALKRGSQNNITITMKSASNIANTFLNKMKSSGYKCGLYTNDIFAKYYLSKDLRNSYDIWYAQYSGKCTYWNRYTMWQYTQEGTVNGINGPVDLNFYYKPNSTSSINLSSATINSIKSQKYTGKQITPSINVKYNNKTLIKNTDYTVSYKNNTYIGTATATIKGKGKYNGTKSITFKIIPTTVTNAKVSSTTSSSIKLNWSKVSNGRGYQIYRSTSKNGTYSKIKEITSNSTTSYTNTNLSSNKTYYYKIRSFKVVNGTKYYGYYTPSFSGTTKLSTPSVTLTSPKTKTISISWKKVSGAKGYEVYRATSKSGTYSKRTTTSKLNYTNTGTSKGKTYYYKVRGYKIINDKKVYSSYSSIKSIKSK